MVFWHKGGNKLWNSVAQRCKLFPSQRKYTGEAGIGLGLSDQRWKAENTLVRQEFILEGSVPHPSLASCSFGWQRQLRLGWLWGEVCAPWLPGLPGAPVPSLQVSSPRVTMAAQLSQALCVCVCFWQAVLSSFSLSILRDLHWCWQGKGDEQHSLCWESMCAGAVRAHLVSEGS